MIKNIFIPFLLLTNLFALNHEVVKQLQDEFKEQVLLTNAFRQRYNTYLQKKCEDNFECYESYINRLKNWESVQNDKILQNIINKKKTLETIDKTYWEKINDKLLSQINSQKLFLKDSQFISIINLDKQLLILSLWDSSEQRFYYIGQDYISSGNLFREAEIKLGEDHYFKTPSGIFKSKIGWRSDGKLNEDKQTLGYGYKNRFVFYFGKQESIRYNTFDENGNKIEDINSWKLITDHLDLALHSHKSSKSFGEPHSHGCVRMSDELNRFMDDNMVLHKNMIENGSWMEQYTQKPSNPKNPNLAGEYLFIFDKL